MRSAAVVANSPSTAADLNRFGVSAIGIVPPGHDAPKEPRRRELPSLRPQVIFVGRLVETKKPHHAIAAFVELRRAFPLAEMHIVGRGYLLPELRRLAVGHPVHFHGHISDAGKNELLSQADIALVPGTREGWGIVAIEAAAHGVPVIGYRIPGLRDAVLDDVTGILTDCAAPNMASAAINLLSDAHRWHAMSRSAQLHAQAFSWQRSASELLAILSPRCIRTAARPAQHHAPVASQGMQ
jgi:glycosyltransferase involved in cell wall biosynthesis